jgi:polyisoprenoid-binding protein YceI
MVVDLTVSRLVPSVVGVLLLCLAGGSAPLRGAEFQIDPQASTLVVKVYRSGIARAMGHDHVVRATRFEGNVRFAPQSLEDFHVALTVDATALVADEPEMRERFGARGSPLSERERREIQEAMEGPDQLDVARYPEIRFESTAVEPLSGERYQVSGRFTLHGTTRAVRFPVTVERRGGSLRATGSFDFEQRDFGIEPFRFALGAVSNRNTVTLHFDLVARH